MDQAGRNTFEMVNRIGPPDPRRENYAVLTPAGAVPPSPEQIVPGVHLKTSMPAPGVGRLVAHGNLLHRTASMAFCQASVRDADGKLVGHGTGTFKYMNGLPVGGGGRRIHKLNASD